MLLFGHTGLTIGLAIYLEKVVNRSCAIGHRITRQYAGNTVQPLATDPVDDLPPPVPASRAFLKLDYRVILIGSLLPDIIDKPLGLLILRDTLGNGRTIAHTLLFNLVLIFSGYLLYSKKGQYWLFTLACASLIHLIFDYLWLYPHIPLWPLFGFSFPQYDPSDWLFKTVLHNLGHPHVYIPEIIGFIIFIILMTNLVRKQLIGQFIKKGQLY